MTFRNRALLDCARDLPCSSCGADDGTIVPAHSNEIRHGHGKGIKSSDACFCCLCHRCHFEYDQGLSMDRDQKRIFFALAMCQTYKVLMERGYLRLTTPKERS
jgi:nitrite reductase/ring-hydroxylating ferredoxin subunit